MKVTSYTELLRLSLAEETFIAGVRKLCERELARLRAREKQDESVVFACQLAPLLMLARFLKRKFRYSPPAHPRTEETKFVPRGTFFPSFFLPSVFFSLLPQERLAKRESKTKQESTSLWPGANWVKSVLKVNSRFAASNCGK